MCGRRKVDRDYPEIKMNYGDMDFDLVKLITKEVPNKIVIQFHNSGEPTLYPRLGEALKLFSHQIRCFDTNGKLLLEKYDDIVNNLETLTISVIENDPEGDEQYEIVKHFVEKKQDKTPRLIYRLLGNVEKRERWEALPGIITTRILHHPMGSFKYSKNPTVPEIGICLEILNHLAIDRFGRVHPCVRFDPLNKAILGDLNKESLEAIWNGEKRRKYLEEHIKGNRANLPLCDSCEFWGVPTGS